MIDEIDANHDGEIDFHEFLDLMLDKKSRNS